MSTPPPSRFSIDAVPCALVVHRGGQITLGNARASALFGVASLDAIVGTPIAQWLNDPALSSLLHSATDAVEIDLRRSDGTPVAALASVTPDPSSAEPIWVCAFTDISAHKQAEAQRDRFFSLALDMLCIAKDGYFKRVNPAFTQTLGWSEHEILSRPYFDFVHPEDLAGSQAVREGQARGEAVAYFEQRFRCKDGTYRWLGWRSMPTPDGLRYATARDLTESKQAQAAIRAHAEALDQARKAAEHANHAKSAFLAAMSHEIRTPMNGVIGMAEVLCESVLTEQQADSARTIRDSALSLLGIIDDILDFSKIEAGKVELEALPYSLEQVVEALCTSLGTVAARCGVDLSVFVDPNLPERIIGDALRFRQVLCNLLGNAIKFSGGRAEVRGRVRVRIERTGGERLVVRVIDNGIGIPPEALGLLFARFTQAEASTTRRFGGSGLGLAIAARIVELMGGEIAVESMPGVGSTFSVHLPFVTAGATPRVSDLHGVEVSILASEELSVADLRSWLADAGAVVDVPDVATGTVWNGSAASIVLCTPAFCPPAHPVGRVVQLTRAAEGEQTNAIGRGVLRQRDASAFVTIDLDNLRRHNVLHAVAVASGRTWSQDRQSAKPVTAARSGAEVPPPTVAEARARGQLILVAEDDAVNRRVILRQLALLDMTAEVASSGAEALELWRRGAYALLLTDLHMPGMDGYALTEAIRKEESVMDGVKRRLPIVALTANALRGEANRARAVGMDDYLTKPLLLGQLKAALRRWIPDDSRVGRALTPPMPVLEEGVGVIDIHRLRSLVGDDEAVVRDVLIEFAASARSLSAGMAGAEASGDARQVAALAHQLKSACSIVGAFAFRDVCIEVENAAALGNSGLVRERLSDLQLGLGPVLTAVDGLISDSVLVFPVGHP